MGLVRCQGVKEHMADLGFKASASQALPLHQFSPREKQRHSKDLKTGMAWAFVIVKHLPDCSGKGVAKCQLGASGNAGNTTGNVAISTAISLVCALYMTKYKIPVLFKAG